MVWFRSTISGALTGMRRMAEGWDSWSQPGISVSVHMEYLLMASLGFLLAWWTRRGQTSYIAEGFLQCEHSDRLGEQQDFISITFYWLQASHRIWEEGWHQDVDSERHASLREYPLKTIYHARLFSLDESLWLENISGPRDGNPTSLGILKL